jgi:hypothetical protein
MNLKTINFFLIAIFFLNNFAAKVNAIDEHKYYTSHLNMKYDVQSKTFQLSFSIFTDDLESTLKKESGEKIRLDEITDANKKLVFEYVKDHFWAIVDGKFLKLENIGYELNVDVIWIYIETSETEIPESIEIANTILFDLYPEQKNMVKINIGEDDYSALLTIKNPVEVIKLNKNE